jgi:hypothetical protein
LEAKQAKNAEDFAKLWERGAFLPAFFGVLGRSGRFVRFAEPSGTPHTARK